MAAGGLSAHATDRGVNKAPREQHVVQALPGVGRKTANMILNTAVSQPTIPVGTPIFRVTTGTRPPAIPLWTVERRRGNATPKAYF